MNGLGQGITSVTQDIDKIQTTQQETVLELVDELEKTKTELLESLADLEDEIEVYFDDLEERLTKRQKLLIEQVDVATHRLRIRLSDSIVPILSGLNNSPIENVDEDFGGWRANGPVNWMLFSQTAYQNKKVKDIEHLYMTTKVYNAADPPRIDVYTKPKNNSSDADTWYNKKIMYQFPDDVPLLDGGVYLAYVNEPGRSRTSFDMQQVELERSDSGASNDEILMVTISGEEDADFAVQRFGNNITTNEEIVLVSDIEE